MNKLPVSCKRVAQELGLYIRSISKDVKEATSIMDSLKITGIDYNNGIVSIKTCRPGVVIGRRGELINGIANALMRARDVEVHKVVIVEDIETMELHGDLYLFQYEAFDRADWLK